MFDCCVSYACSLGLCLIVAFVMRALLFFFFNCGVSNACFLGLCLIVALVMRALLVCV